MRLPAPPVLLGFAALLCGDADAQAIHRCAGPDGVTIYSDRSCSALGAVELRAPATAADAGTARTRPDGRSAPPGCARRPNQLAAQLRAALDSGDVNRVAGLYDWTGTGQRDAERLMHRLSILARDTIGSVGLEDAAGLPLDPRQGDAATPPAGIRIDRVPTPLFRDPVQRFRLVQRAGCWWVRF
ncbi:hypothetical protein [Coralloluteibacterium thermophilus]|uniref:DUF4124 domain-containing protein n=1 Tax=Coralloluteibacterium thermophilum TaxID=2707049 RepID=A0ABV9NGZ0_9GAMM